MNKILLLVVIVIFVAVPVYSVKITKKEHDTLKSMKSIDALFVLTESFTYPEYTEFLSRNIAYIQDNESYILAVNRDRFLGIWGKNSTFLGEVGSIGKGPGEYISPWGSYFYTLTHDEVKKTMTFSKYTVKL